MVHESIIRGYHVYKDVWKPKIGLGSTARAMHDQHAVNSARMRLTASIKPGKYVCAYEKVCTYKKGAPNNPSLRYVCVHESCIIMYGIQHQLLWCRTD